MKLLKIMFLAMFILLFTGCSNEIASLQTELKSNYNKIITSYQNDEATKSKTKVAKSKTKVAKSKTKVTNYKKRRTSEEYINFVKKTKYQIPVLPIEALHHLEFRRFLVCNLKSPEWSILDVLSKLNKTYYKKKYSNNFEKRKAKKKLEEKKKKYILEEKNYCKGKIIPPVFYSDIYLPINDKDEKIHFKTIEIVNEKGKRKDSYSTNGHLGITAYPSFIGATVMNRSPKPYAISLTWDEKEKLYSNARKYKGSYRYFSRHKEIKGKMYFSLSSSFTSSFIRDPIITIYPIYYNIPNLSKGKYYSYAPWVHKNRDYRDLTAYKIMKK